MTERGRERQREIERWQEVTEREGIERENGQSERDKGRGNRERIERGENIQRARVR